MTEPLATEVLATLRDVLSSDSPLALEPTKKLARMLAGCRLATIETSCKPLS